MENTPDIEAGTLEERFSTLLDRHRGIVFRVAGSYSRQRAEREDLVQEICTQLWRAFPRYDGQRRFSTWMYRVALNVAISHARAERWDGPDRFEPLDEQHLHMAGDADPSDGERLRAMHAAIQELDPLNRALILLYLDERSYAEIAEVLGISETNVATRISRARQTLRARLAEPQRKPTGE